MGDLQALLLSFESRLESAKGNPINIDGSQPAANTLSHNYNSRNYNSNGQQGRGKGYQGSQGENQSNGGRGQQRGGNRGRGRGNQSNRPVCQVCKKPNHTADKCRHKYDQTYVAQAPNSPPQYAQHGNFQHNPILNMVNPQQSLPSGHAPSFTNSEYSYDSSWFPDSGATHHVSHDLSNLNITSKYNGGNRLHGEWLWSGYCSHS